MPQTTTVPKAQAKNSLLQSESLVQLLGVDAVQILKCGICLEFFDLPIVLPCGHTFCLHCLTEMCSHASRSNSHTSLQDIRIGCPNCRILIYASPVLERNVTCNFIIQSLIELLRARPNRQTQDKGVNTDEVRIGPKVRTPSDSDVARLMGDLDRMTEALGKRNVVDMAYFEVDEIRRSHLAREMDSKPMECTDHRGRSHFQTPESYSFPTTKSGGMPFNPKPALLNANPPNPSPYLTTASITRTGSASSAAIPKAAHPNKSVFSHSNSNPLYYGLPQTHRISASAQLHLQNRHHQHQQQQQQQQQQQLQQQPSGLTAEKAWPADHHPPNNSNAHNRTPSTKMQTTVEAPGGVTTLSATHQTSLLLTQPAFQMRKESNLLLARSDSRLTTHNKMVAMAAATCTTTMKGSPDNGGHHNRKHISQEQTPPVCGGRLDNDPAVMSYSCTSVCPTSSQYQS